MRFAFRFKMHSGNVSIKEESEGEHGSDLNFPFRCFHSKVQPILFRESVIGSVSTKSRDL